MEPRLVKFEVEAWIDPQRTKTVQEEIEIALIASSHVQDFGVDRAEDVE